MTAVKTDIGAFSQAGRLPFAPTSNIPQTDVQQAIEAVRAAVAALNSALAAPQYLTGAASGDLANERVVTDTATVAWDLATGGQAKANVVDASVSNAKLATMAQATVKGRASGAGTGAPVDLTASQLLDILKGVDGTGSGLDADTLDGVEGAAFALLADLASNDNGKGAALVGIEDAGSYFAGTTVEAALAYLGAAVAALDKAVVLKGDWSAAAGTFPGSGTAQAGWSYIVSADGTVDGIEFKEGDRIVALVDNASTSTYATNWLKLDYTDRVSSVDGQVGAVDLSGTYQPLDSDLTALAALAPSNNDIVQRKSGAWTNRTMAQLISDLAALGTTFQPLAAVLTTIAGLSPSNDDVLQLKAGAWANRTIAQLLTDLVAGGALKNSASATLSAGFKASPYSAGTKSSGTFTPDAANGNFQYATNGGAHTLAPPSDACSICLEYTNNGSAGAVTTSGFTKVTGDSFTTTNGHKFLCWITKHQNYSHLHVQALQ